MTEERITLAQRLGRLGFTDLTTPEGLASFYHVSPRCEHVWDGPGGESEDGRGSWSNTCSKCGIDPITVAMRE